MPIDLGPIPEIIRRPKKILWYARGGGLARMGPFESQVEAVKALRTMGSTPTYPIYPSDSWVWPEEEL